MKGKGVALRALQQLVYGQDDRILNLEDAVRTLKSELDRLKQQSLEGDLLKLKSNPAPYTSPTVYPNTPWISPTIWAETGLPLNVCIFGAGPASPEDLARKLEETPVQVKNRRNAQ